MVGVRIMSHNQVQPIPLILFMTSSISLDGGESAESQGKYAGTLPHLSALTIEHIHHQDCHSTCATNSQNCCGINTVGIYIWPGFFYRGIIK